MFWMLLIFGFYPCVSHGDDVDDLVKEVGEYQGAKQKATEDHTAQVYKEKGKEIEAKRAQDKALKQSVEASLAADFEAEAKLDRVPHPGASKSWEPVPDAFIHFIDDHFKKNSFRVMDSRPCTGSIGHKDVAWVDDDIAEMKKTLDSTLAREDPDYMSDSAVAMHTCYQKLDGAMQDAALTALGTRNCLKVLGTISESTQDLGTVIRIISAEYLAGTGKYPTASEKECLDDHFNGTKFQKEFWGKNPPPLRADLREKANKLRELRKTKNAWFPSKEMYLWANALEHSRQQGKKLTEDEFLRNSNVVRRMKAYDPLFSEFSETRAKQK